MTVKVLAILRKLDSKTAYESTLSGGLFGRFFSASTLEEGIAEYCRDLPELKVQVFKMQGFGQQAYAYRCGSEWGAFATEQPLQKKSQVLLYLRNILSGDFELNELKDSPATYMTTPGGQKIEEIVKALDETKDIMIKNIDLVLERGDKLDDLLDQTAELQFQTREFHRASEDLNRCFPRWMPCNLL